MDIFLEELAKVGGEKLPQEVLDTFLLPYYQVQSHHHHRFPNISPLHYTKKKIPVTDVGTGREKF